MSITVVFNRQFIRSELGITPCWEAGDNRTWTDSGPHARMVRSWSIFHNLLGVSEEELMSSAQKYLGSNEHWQNYGGKMVDDAAYLRWLKNGCKQAATIEDILFHNNLRAADCKLSVWLAWDKQKDELVTGVRDTKELDEWILAAKTRIAEVRAMGGSAYPIINFYTEKLVHPPIKKRAPSAEVVFKCRNSYLVEVSASGSSWSYDPKKAHIYTQSEADTLLASTAHGWIREARILDASVVNRPYNAILQFTDGVHQGQYISRRTRSKIAMTYTPEYAKKYVDTAAAQRALKTLQPKVRKYGNLQVVTLPNI